MVAKNKIIIDTDPGVDDIMALLLALSASPKDLELAMISVTYGNVPLELTIRNIVALFHVLGKELEWRKSTGRDPGFEVLREKKILVAGGARHPIDNENLEFDYFHGRDGLHNVQDAFPDLAPDDSWKPYFDEKSDSNLDPDSFSPFFTPSKTPSSKEMLRILRENPPDTVTILAVGPLTNVALAALEDPETFLRVKELVVMGGAVHVEGNVTPVAEFNTFADPTSAALVYSLTSKYPSSTFPVLPKGKLTLDPFYKKLSRQLKLTLHPLDITTPHLIHDAFWKEKIKPILESGSPLGRWVGHCVGGAFKKIDEIFGEGADPGLSMHDPLTVWYMMTRDDPKWVGVPQLEDLRIETTGQWTKGMHVVDKRQKKKPAEAEVEVEMATEPGADPEQVVIHETTDPQHSWMAPHKGNRLNRITASPGFDIFKHVWLEHVFGPIFNSSS